MPDFDAEKLQPVIRICEQNLFRFWDVTRGYAQFNTEVDAMARLLASAGGSTHSCLTFAGRFSARINNQRLRASIADSLKSDNTADQCAAVEMAGLAGFAELAAQMRSLRFSEDLHRLGQLYSLWILADPSTVALGESMLASEESLLAQGAFVVLRSMPGYCPPPDLLHSALDQHPHLATWALPWMALLHDAPPDDYIAKTLESAQRPRDLKALASALILRQNEGIARSWLTSSIPCTAAFALQAIAQQASWCATILGQMADGMNSDISEEDSALCIAAAGAVTAPRSAFTSRYAHSDSPSQRQAAAFALLHGEAGAESLLRQLSADSDNSTAAAAEIIRALRTGAGLDSVESILFEIGTTPFAAAVLYACLPSPSDLHTFRDILDGKSSLAEAAEFATRRPDLILEALAPERSGLMMQLLDFDRAGLQGKGLTLIHAGAASRQANIHSGLEAEAVYSRQNGHYPHILAHLDAYDGIHTSAGKLIFAMLCTPAGEQVHHPAAEDTAAAAIAVLTKGPAEAAKLRSALQQPETRPLLRALQYQQKGPIGGFSNLQVELRHRDPRVRLQAAAQLLAENSANAAARRILLSALQSQDAAEAANLLEKIAGRMPAADFLDLAKISHTGSASAQIISLLQNVLSNHKCEPLIALGTADREANREECIRDLIQRHTRANSSIRPEFIGRRILLEPFDFSEGQSGRTAINQESFSEIAGFLKVEFADAETGSLICKVSGETTGEVFDALLARDSIVLFRAFWT